MSGDMGNFFINYHHRMIEICFSYQMHWQIFLKIIIFVALTCNIFTKWEFKLMASFWYYDVHSYCIYKYWHSYKKRKTDSLDPKTKTWCIHMHVICLKLTTTKFRELSIVRFLLWLQYFLYYTSCPTWRYLVLS